MFYTPQATVEKTLVAYEGVSDEFAQALERIKIGEGVYGKVAQTGQSTVAKDISNDPIMAHPEVKKMLIKTQLVVPLLLKDHVQGVICVAMRRPREFTQEDIDLLSSVGSQIATSMANASLYEKERMTARKLTVSERRCRQLFENANDAILVNDLNGNITSANGAAARLSGYSLQELTKMNIREFITEESLSAAGDVRRRLMEKQPVDQPYEQRLMKRDGSEAIVEVTTALVMEDGKTVGFQNIARDVTEERQSEELLRESERKLSQIVNGSSVPTFVINNEHITTHWNKACKSLTGISATEVIGTKRQWQPFYPEERPSMADLIVDKASEEEISRYYGHKYTESSLLEGAYEVEDFFPAVGPNGKWIFFTAAPLIDHEGRLLGAIETLQDVTERVRADEALKDSESRYRDLFNNASDAIIISDMEGNIIEVNKAASDLTGYTSDELVKMSLKEFMTAESFETAIGGQQKVLLRGDTASERYELEIVKKDGAHATIEAAVRPVKEMGQAVAFHNIARDVTEERRIRDNLRYYLQQITRVQEEERERIARELHDDTVQALYALNRQIDNFLRDNTGLSEDDKNFLQGIGEQSREILQSVRRFSQDLRPPILDDLGLLPALRWLTSDVQGRSGVEIDLNLPPDEQRLPSEEELPLFRIVQEALRNIERHSQASKANIEVEFGENTTRISISDNGKGFEFSGDTAELPRSGKLGLAGMAERARLLGGELTIQSAVGKGTKVIVEVPNIRRE
ncbi:MAG: PAS domain S-box protein [Chloroflexota bacterium]